MTLIRWSIDFLDFERYAECTLLPHIVEPLIIIVQKLRVLIWSFEILQDSSEILGLYYGIIDSRKSLFHIKECTYKYIE